MLDVSYQFRFPYLRRPTGSLFPGLTIQLRNPMSGARTLDISAELDSGAEYSLFDGQVARTIALDPFDGARFSFRLASGTRFESRILPVILCHNEIGDIGLNARFSTAPIPTNILGRDFFDFVLVGFDEHSSEVFLGLR